jgi:hypothetical protein
MGRLVCIVLVAFTLAAAGTAAFPGTNGRLVFVQERDSLERSVPPVGYVCASPPDGARPTKVVDAPDSCRSRTRPSRRAEA